VQITLALFARRVSVWVYLLWLGYLYYSIQGATITLSMSPPECANFTCPNWKCDLPALL